MAKKRGRPLNPPTPGKRAALGLKVTPEIKQRLDQAAKFSGRTQSQEAEARLDQSFHREDLLPEILSNKCGPQLTGVLMLLVEALSLVRLHEHFRMLNDPSAEHHDPLSISTTDIDDSSIFAEIEEAAEVILAELRPPATPVGDVGDHGEDRRHSSTTSVGWWCAQLVLLDLKRRDLKPEHSALQLTIRRKLGSLCPPLISKEEAQTRMAELRPSSEPSFDVGNIEPENLGTALPQATARQRQGRRKR